MNRTLNTLKLDIRLQFRYGFYYAAIFVTVLWTVLLLFIPESFLPKIVPFIIFIDLSVIGFYFIAGQIIFEKTEKTIYALILTPLTFREYLASKLMSLTVLAWVISMVVVIAVYGVQFNFFLLSLGIILTSVLELLIGVIAVVPYQSISTFIVPSSLYVILLYLPLINYFGLFKSVLFYLIPTQGSIMLLFNAFQGTIDIWQLAYAVLYPVLWIAILIMLAKARFEHFIIAGKGGR